MNEIRMDISFQLNISIFSRCLQEMKGIVVEII